MFAQRFLAAGALAAMVLTGCASPDQPEPTGSSDVAPQGVDDVLAAHGLDGLETKELIDTLDRLPPDARPTDLMASVRPNELVLTAGDDEKSLPMPKDQFYVSFAPYVDQTHECFHHSLTTCLGEMAAQEVHVMVIEQGTKAVLVDEEITTFDNGFVGLWLPRGIEGRIRVTQGDLRGKTRFATTDKAATCLTTLQLT
jgi:hypothetical protein